MIVIEIFVIMLILLGEAFFSGSETALISCNRMKIRHKVEKGSSRAKILWSLLESPHRIMATMLVGTNLCVVTSTIIATHLCIVTFGDKGPIIATVIMTPLILVFGEIIPKALFRFYADKVLSLIAPVLKLLQTILLPVVIIIEKLSGFLLVGLKHTEKDPFITKKDLELLVRQITREGVLELSEQEAIHQILDFRYTRVGDVMTTLREVVSFDYNDTRNIIINKARQSKFTRYPVMKNKNIEGIINVYDLFYNEGDWRKHIRPVRKIYANQKIVNLFIQMRNNRELMCTIVRKGKLVGIITLEDIIEEIELT